MKIQLYNNTPIPSILVIGCAQSFGCEHIEVDFPNGWKKLKKSITFYLNDDETDCVTLPIKKSVLIPDKIYVSSGTYRYVIVGENKKRRIVSKTGYLTVLSAPEGIKHSEPYVHSAKGGK